MDESVMQFCCIGKSLVPKENKSSVWWYFWWRNGNFQTKKDFEKVLSVDITVWKNRIKQSFKIVSSIFSVKSEKVLMVLNNFSFDIKYVN